MKAGRPGRMTASIGGGFLPSRVANLSAWYDASTTTAGSVSSWTDKSGNGYHATQGTGSLQPTCTANQLNSKNVLLFDGGDRLDLPAGLLTLTNGNNTAFAVSKRNSEAGTADRIMSMVESGVANHYALGYSATSGTVVFASRTAGGGDVTKAGATNTNYQIIMGRRSGTTQAVTYNNNTEATNTNGASTSTTNAGSIGSNIGLQFLTGGIAEIIVYSRSLSVAEINQVVRYLSNKWGITIV